MLNLNTCAWNALTLATKRRSINVLNVIFIFYDIYYSCRERGNTPNVTSVTTVSHLSAIQLFSLLPSIIHAGENRKSCQSQAKGTSSKQTDRKTIGESLYNCQSATIWNMEPVTFFSMVLLNCLSQGNMCSLKHNKQNYI